MTLRGRESERERGVVATQRESERERGVDSFVSVT